MVKIQHFTDSKGHPTVHSHTNARKSALPEIMGCQVESSYIFPHWDSLQCFQHKSKEFERPFLLWHHPPRPKIKK